MDDEDVEPLLYLIKKDVITDLNPETFTYLIKYAIEHNLPDILDQIHISCYLTSTGSIYNENYVLHESIINTSKYITEHTSPEIISKYKLLFDALNDNCSILINSLLNIENTSDTSDDSWIDVINPDIELKFYDALTDEELKKDAFYSKDLVVKLHQQGRILREHYLEIYNIHKHKTPKPILDELFKPGSGELWKKQVNEFNSIAETHNLQGFT